MTNTVNPIIPYIEGDGIGPEIWQATKKVIDAAVSSAYKNEKKFDWLEILAGEKAFNQTGTWLPNETLEAIKKYKVAIKGPLTTPIGEGFRSLNVTLRQELDLYACVRPVRYFEGVPSPLKEPEKTDMTIFRENTEDVYAGIEFSNGSQEVKQLLSFLTDQLSVTKVRFPATSALGIKPISKEGSERLVAAALDYAIEQEKTRVTLVHKGNIMKFTEGGFKKWGYDYIDKHYPQAFTIHHYNQISEESTVEKADEALAEARAAGKIIVDDVIADNFLQQILLYPEKYQVVATTNLNGDYISDALAAQVGGIGISPGANINYKTGHAIFEATHGTAPDIAGKGWANPCSLLLSAVMMLDHLGWFEASQKVTKAIEQALQNNQMTHDFAQMLDIEELSTTEFADYLIASIQNEQ
ncbi:NADP-dependent isocitrate dehydrogenase [Enterococcus hulanensis]|uniref:Isocitrate dehydrogenase [NADP] n=1 Tax=Enterococcus hulanensis TaxID=2559929 RepID=A0ABU3F3P4_9ENTE|nr:NADP-dependent isocitrate dehydrogenase [Enterococcus hulanensis]MDT2601763.1 NADP-dependent isocitrate dehydrogenase [Enterococcus hulanensis]MDT2611148.1 NADP-dependent isocitrate dehydrogenase [Enterococcus hulanensis]MDT2618566.1 NADP-dependent isocitrate dehydrogenase [Enterococcus hulanensis]MDT2629711.1 NADP-dependent isocitrate dehydrogenase [Enterococcus hulanensis]MDT2657443.1 NADP-dependent isocitrate dehydrogenase [Enterococcus hulanensis]